MKRLIPLFFVLFLMGCNSEDPTQRIEKLEKQAFSTEGAIDQNVGSDLVQAYCDFADANSSDSMAPEYLFKAVDVAMNLNDTERTLSIIDRLIGEYPEYQNTSKALFVKAFLYENQLGDLDKAKQLYEQYLEMYPDGELADDCRASIENLGLSPEELVRRFEGQD